MKKEGSISLSHPGMKTLFRAGRTCGAARRWLALVLMLILLISASGCSAWPDWNGMPETTVPVSESLPSDRDQPTTTTTAPSATTASPTEIRTETSSTAETSAQAKKDLDEAFAEQAALLIESGLAERNREISLDPLMEVYLVGKDQVDAVIEQLYAIYQRIFADHPQYFYLNGSARVRYTLLTGNQGHVQSMTLIPQYFEFSEGMTDAQISQKVFAVEQVVEAIATEISSQTSEPWRQLQLAHQVLIRMIAYDETENQENNHAAAALLEGKTLCQGYAQAFQLIGRRLGFDVQLITGTSDGQGHAWNLVSLDGRFYHVDVTHDDPVPDRGPDHPVRHIHFMRSDSLMRESHQWEAANYPVASSDGAHYYRQNGLLVNSLDDLESQLATLLRSHDFSSRPVLLYEALYTSSDLPDRQAVEAAFSSALAQSQLNRPIFYRLQIIKSVIFIEVSLS